MRNRIFARFVMAFTSIFMAIETNAAELGSFGPYIPGAQMELNLGLIGYKAKKLPSGLKLDKKTGFVKGKAKKPGEYISTFTKKDDETHTAKFVIGPLRTITISMEGDIEKCKVTGATKPGKGYLVGKKVTLSAKGPKGTAFNGWFMAGKPWPNESEYLESRVRHVMTEENLSLVARFEKEKMSVLCNRLLKPIPVGRDFSTPILIETQSGIKSVRASKLPTGLKVKKDKSTGAWYIQGKAKKEGIWKTVIKVTAKSGAVKQLAINVTVNDGTSSGGNLTDANGYFTDNLQNGDGENYSLSMDSGDIDSLLPSLALSSPSAKLNVTGLPEGLTYDSSTGKIKGKATKAGSYTVTLTVTDNGSIYISTITIVVRAPANSCDLLVSSVTATRTTVYIGEKFNLRYVVKNGSNFDSQLFKNKISASGGFSAIEQICGGLAKNDEVAFRAQIDSGRLGVGAHEVTILADSGNDALEADETNNQKTIILNVLELPTTNTLVDWEFKAKMDNEDNGAAFLSTASTPQEKSLLFNKGETIYAQINFWNNLHQVVRAQITASALLDTGVNNTWYWNGLGADVFGFIPNEHRRASILQGLQPGVYTLEILLDSDRFVNSNGDYAYYTEASKLNNSEIIEFTIAGDDKVVTFDANGGLLSPNTKTLTKGSKIGEMPVPALKGYRFDGWYTAKDGGVEITSETLVAKNMTLYAKWTAKPYIVRYHKNDSQGTTFDQTFTTGVAGDLRGISNFGWTVNGYAFTGWATSADGEIKYRDGETISHIETDSDDVAHLYAVWTYEIILHKNDGSGTTESQTCRLRKDQHLMRINEDLEWDNPTDLFSFAGWATSPDGSVKYDDGVTVVLSNDAVINLYAVWRGTEYIVRFHKSSDSTMSEDQIHTVGIPKALTTITELAWRMDGCEFAGWSTIQGGDVEFADGEEVRNLIEESGEVYNLYAVWRGNNYTVKFHKNFGTGASEIFAQTNTVGVAQELLGYTNFNWGVTGYRFAGWATSTTGDVIFSDGQEVEDLTMSAWGNYDLYAVWEYDVKYNKNDGTNESTNETFVVGKEQALMDINSDLNWSVVGKVFLGWATNQVDYTSTADYIDAVVYSNSVVVADIDPNPDAINQVVRELYAVWIPSYSINFHSNDGTSRSKLLIFGSDEDAVLPFVEDDWQWETPKNDISGELKGWSTSRETTVPEYKVGDKIKDIKDIPPGQTINLYAVWEKERYAIMYHKNDGSGIIVTNTYALEEYHTLQDVNNDLNWTPNNVEDFFYAWSTLPMDSTGTNTVYTNCYEVTTGYIEGIKEDKHVDLYAIMKSENRALDLPLDQYLKFTGDGNAAWFLQDVVKTNGYLAMQSGELQEGESSILQATISGPVNVSFWWRISARHDYGLLRVLIGDAVKDVLRIPENADPLYYDTGWVSCSIDIPEGNHTIKWVYTQEACDTGGLLGGKPLNCGWVDGLIIKPISGGSDIPSVANTTQYAMRSTRAITTTTMSLLNSSRITGQFVDDSTLFEFLVDDVNAAITSGKLTEYCEEGVITSECDVERVEEGLVLTQDNRIILIKISNGVATAEIIMD